MVQVRSCTGKARGWEGKSKSREGESKSHSLKLQVLRKREPVVSSAQASDDSLLFQIENEYGFYSDDKKYLQHLLKNARRHLGKQVIMYVCNGFC